MNPRRARRSSERADTSGRGPAKLAGSCSAPARSVKYTHATTGCSGRATAVLASQGASLATETEVGAGPAAAAGAAHAA